MNELENEFNENLDEDFNNDDISNEQDDSSDENLDTSKKNKSNWKEMSKALKGANAKIAALESELTKRQIPSENSSDLRLFFLENPSLIEYKDTITQLKTNDKYKNLDMEDLVELAKIKQPKPSVDSDDFNVINKVKSGKKQLSDLTDEEALKLDNRTYLEWSKSRKTNNVTRDIWG